MRFVKRRRKKILSREKACAKALRSENMANLKI